MVSRLDAPRVADGPALTTVVDETTDATEQSGMTPALLEVTTARIEQGISQTPLCLPTDGQLYFDDLIYVGAPPSNPITKGEQCTITPGTTEPGGEPAAEPAPEPGTMTPGTEPPSEFPPADDTIILEPLPPSDSPPTESDLKVAHRQPKDFAGMVEQNWGKLDANHDGQLDEKELKKALTDPSYKGVDAQMVLALYQNHNDLARLNIKGFEGMVPRLTLDDIKQFDEKLQSEQDKPENKRNKDFAGLVAKVDLSMLKACSSSNMSNLNLYGDSADPTDNIKAEAVRQGSLGDCYFMASMAAVAALKPEAIYNMIRTNGDGTYTVTFPGKKDKPITIPAPSEAELVLFAHGGEHGIWPAVLEKAHRQLTGKWTSDNGGSPKDALKLLTGADPAGYQLDQISFGAKHLPGPFAIPTVTIGRDSAEAVGKALELAMAEHRPVVATVDSTIQNLLNPITGAKETDLPDHHVYSVVGYDPVTKMVTIRNPWGRTGVEGENVDARYAPGEDGIFTMKLEDFIHDFQDMSVSRR